MRKTTRANSRPHIHSESILYFPPLALCFVDLWMVVTNTSRNLVDVVRPSYSVPVASTP
jgi:hypothetical protein